MQYRILADKNVSVAKLEQATELAIFDWAGILVPARTVYVEDVSELTNEEKLIRYKQLYVQVFSELGL